MGRKNRIYTGKIKDENGAVLIVALMMLCLLTIISTAVSKTTSIEIMISGADKDKKETFYAAEAGVDHIKALMASIFKNRNNLKLAQGQIPDWDFALNGSEPGVNAAGTTADTGARWITNAPCGGYVTYSVVVWDNDDGDGDPTKDVDQIIFIRATATSLQGGSTSIELSLHGDVSGADAIVDYKSRGGRRKTFTSGDYDPISATDFIKQT
jgi:type IV pilus assembly protein PilX